MTEESLLHASLEIDDLVQRAAFLDEKCAGQPDLRARLDDLLHAHQRADDLFPTADPDANPLPGAVGSRFSQDFTPNEAPGDIIGRYKLLQRIGSGGFGVVWMAEQTEPVRRKVALKLLRPGLDSGRVLARFEAERQALAVMDHPNVAKVFDAGATDKGRPFFVMELVKGIPITDYCDQNRVPLAQRIELFAQVCAAIQHAHQKGIIHRDIKPANVLVASYDGRPVPKVIDFGLAKALTQPLTDRTLFTSFGEIIGTFQYMSPEQVSFNALDIDTRSDVYSLGVLFYELLTGSTPLTKERLSNLVGESLFKAIREEEAPRPSDRLSESKDDLSSLCAQRQIEPLKLRKLVRGDLDWIAIKSLEKDRGRRYGTPTALADDLKRFLADELVEARPPSVSYRVGKFVRKNKGLAFSTAAVLLALVGGLGVAGFGYVQAVNAEQAIARDRDVKESLRVRAETNEQTAIREAATAKAALEKTALALAEAERQRKVAEAAGTKSEWQLYASYLALAQAAWNENNAWLAHHYLDGCRRDFRGWEHDYLYTRFSQNQTTLRGHTSGVTSVAWSPDGRLLLTGSYDNTLKVWDTVTGQLSRTLKGHLGWVTSVAWSPDGKRFISGSADKTLKVWDADTGQEITLKGHLNWVRSVAWSPDGKRLVSGSEDKTLKVWDAATGKETQTLEGHSGTVFALAWSPDGKRLVSGSGDKTLKVWDADTGKEITLKGHTNVVTSVAWSPDGKVLLSGGADNTLKAWDAATGQEHFSVKGHTDVVMSVAWSPDGKVLFSGGADRTLKVWDAATGRETFTLKGHTGTVFALALSPDGKRLLSGSEDKTLKIWDAATEQETLTIKGHPGSVFTAAWSPDGKRFVSGSYDNTLKVWDAASGMETFVLKGHSGWVTSVAWSPDGRRILSSSEDGTLKVWDAATNQEIFTVKGHSSRFSSVAWSPDGKRLLSGGGMLKVWDAATGEEILTAKGQTGTVASVAWSPDGKRLLSGGSTLKVWDAATGDEIFTLKGHTGKASSVAWSPDGKRLLSGGSTLKVWDAATGDETLSLKGHTTSSVCSVAWSPDGRRLLSGSGIRRSRFGTPPPDRRPSPSRGILLLSAAWLGVRTANDSSAAAWTIHSRSGTPRDPPRN